MSYSWIVDKFYFISQWMNANNLALMFQKQSYYCLAFFLLEKCLAFCTHRHAICCCFFFFFFPFRMVVCSKAFIKPWTSNLLPSDQHIRQISKSLFSICIAYLQCVISLSRALSYWDLWLTHLLSCIFDL